MYYVRLLALYAPHHLAGIQPALLYHSSLQTDWSELRTYDIGREGLAQTRKVNIAHDGRRPRHFA